MLFNNKALQLSKNERLAVIDSSITNNYMSFWENKPIQVPFYKYIKHKDYQLFIGLPFNTSINQAWLMQSVLLKEQKLIYSSDSTTYVYTVEKSDSMHQYELFQKNGKSLFYLLAKTDTNELNDSSFSLTALQARIVDLKQ